MGIPTIDKHEVEVLTEWCRNKPEDAAVEILAMRHHGVEMRMDEAEQKQTERCTEIVDSGCAAIEYLEAIIDDLKRGAKVFESVSSGRGKSFLFERRGALFGVRSVEVVVRVAEGRHGS